MHASLRVTAKPDGIKAKIKLRLRFALQDDGREEQEGEAGCDFGVAGRGWQIMHVLNIPGCCARIKS